MPQPSFVRMVAAATMTYSVAITVAPKLLAGPCRMLDATGEVPPDVKALVRSTGVRDAALAAALLVSRPGPAARPLSVARIASDAADALWFASLPVPSGTRAKIGGVAAGWAAVEALAQWLDERRVRRAR